MWLKDELFFELSAVVCLSLWEIISVYKYFTALKFKATKCLLASCPGIAKVFQVKPYHTRQPSVSITKRAI